MLTSANTQYYRRALFISLMLSLFGELVYWIVWGLILFPDHPWATLRWSIVCGMGMGAVVGALSCLLLVDRVKGKLAVIGSFTIAFVVFGICTVNCWLIDQTTNYWGAVTHPQLFLIAGLIGAGLGGMLYAWLVFTQSGHLLGDRVLGGYFLSQRETTQ